MSQNMTVRRVTGCDEAASTAYHTSTTATSILYATKVIPANTLSDGSIIKLVVVGNLGITSTPDWTSELYVNAASVLSTGALTMAAATAFRMEFVGVVRSVGATGTILWSLTQIADDTGIHTVKCATTANSVDTTAAITLDVYGTWSASSASNTETTQIAYLEVLGS